MDIYLKLSLLLIAVLITVWILEENMSKKDRISFTRRMYFNFTLNTGNFVLLKFFIITVMCFAIFGAFTIMLSLDLPVISLLIVEPIIVLGIAMLTLNTLSNIRRVIEDETKKKLENSLSDELIDNMCFSYRHDFGLLGLTEQDSLRFQAREWYRALESNLKYG